MIGTWAHTASDEETARLVDVLSDPVIGFLRKQKNGRYLIVGNPSQVAKLKAFKEASARGGEKTAQKFGKGKWPKNPPQDAEPHGPAPGLALEEPAAKLPSLPFPSLPFVSSLVSSLRARARGERLLSEAESGSGAGSGTAGEEVPPDSVPSEVAAAQARLIKKRLEAGIKADGTKAFEAPA
jgi:hypothetical protein